MGLIKDKSGTYAETDAKIGASDSRPIPAPGIGRRISTVCDKLGTRRNAARVAGVSSDSLQRYIRDDNMPPFDVAARLCIVGEVRLEWLATGEGSLQADPTQTASDSGSQPLRRDDLMMALQLATEALGKKVLPPAKHAELVTILYELLEEGLPEAKVLRYGRAFVE